MVIGNEPNAEIIRMRKRQLRFLRYLALSGIVLPAFLASMCFTKEFATCMAFDLGLLIFLSARTRLVFEIRNSLTSVEWVTLLSFDVFLLLGAICLLPIICVPTGIGEAFFAFYAIVAVTSSIVVWVAYSEGTARIFPGGA